MLINSRSVIELCYDQEYVADDMEGVWFAPGNCVPQLYEKIEWGVKLPAQVEAAIDNWIHNDQNPGEPPLLPALNPFDPEQVDLKAVIDYTTVNNVFYSQPVYGFFYLPFLRNTTGDVNTWDWEEQPTEFRFRFRWASTEEAHHSVRITLDVPTMGHWEMESFHFASMWHDPRDSFISVTENGHYFKTDDGHVYFPVGLNINEGTFGCNCMEGYTDSETSDADPDFCEACYEWGADDPCCGIRYNKRMRSDIWPEYDANGNTKGVRGYTLDPAAYVKLERVLETLQEKGGNAFRTLIDPTQYDIEFEKLNNYYDRQYQAWEFDRLLDKCNELGLRVELNMMIHYALCSHHDGFDKFDWDFSQNCYGCGDETGLLGTHGYCYWNELGLDTPLDFLIEPLAILNYQKKLRYMIARWGYSNDIFLLELLSEANNVGNIWLNENGTDLNGDGDNQDDKVLVANPYNENPEVMRQAIANWHHEMAEYIKDHLHHRRHLIAADYAGSAPMSWIDENNNDNCDSEEICNPCQQTYFDNSWHSNLIDVIAFSNYNDALNRWEKYADHEYHKTDQSDGLLCGWNNPEETSDNELMHSALNSYESIWKPIVHAEDGYVACLGEDHTGFVKDILVSLFSGHATSGMSWDEWSNTQNWHYFGVLQSFLEAHIWNNINIGQGNWQPGHSYSEYNPDPILDVNQLEARNAEVIYLHNSDDDSELITGIIMNRSWNNFTVSNCGDIPDVFEYAFLDQFYECGFNHDPLWIYENELGIHNYTIRYFDPFTLIKVNEVNRFSALAVETDPIQLTHKIALENYPLMYEGSDGRQPFYFFTIHREAEEFQGMPEISDNLETFSEVSYIKSDLQDATNRVEMVEDALEIYPNPTNADLNLMISPSLINKNVMLLDISGRIIHSQRLSDRSNVLNISHLSSGCYTLIITGITPEKVIIKK